MLLTIDLNTPLAVLTVGQFQNLLNACTQPHTKVETGESKSFIYGIAGIAKLFNCSIPTANRIKASGKIDKAITQIGRKIIIDPDLALELAGKKNGGRR